MTNPTQDELDRLIESWVPINTKDPQWLKLSKIKARADFREVIEAHTQQAVREARLQDDHALYEERERAEAWEDEKLQENKQP